MDNFPFSFSFFWVFVLVKSYNSNNSLHDWYVNTFFEKICLATSYHPCGKDFV